MHHRQGTSHGHASKCTSACKHEACRFHVAWLDGPKDAPAEERPRCPQKNEELSGALLLSALELRSGLSALQGTRVWHST